MEHVEVTFIAQDDHVVVDLSLSGTECRAEVPQSSTAPLLESEGRQAHDVSQHTGANRSLAWRRGA